MCFVRLSDREVFPHSLQLYGFSQVSSHVLATVWLLSCVRSHVSCHAASLTECLPTLLVPVWLVSSVSSHVLATVWLLSCVSSHVLCEAVR